MKKEVYTSFSELRRTSEKMLKLVQRTLAGQEPVNLRTSINDDLGIAGLDWDMFLEEYEKEFKAQLHGLEYTDYFPKEGLTFVDSLLGWTRLLWLLIIYLPARLLEIEKKKILWYTEPQALTIGDLVLSALAGEFVKREQAVIKIKNTSRNKV
ncbi:DUF1493 family protein [Rufibacter glacialis]|uniref:DUF1493 family protein n=1 Tax=Rufibacter glacialis TaxID=1259555 RepID=A0A5M8QPJ9_9BACT|nr:DUF1493 family protein [Rufibacter glacialis]KAA6437999.1 DUF1493 family protein [Rufibacter glacialis]GGK89683.1 hypothetical protein GCM10011405_41730 [Rufibacter glacialis]